MSGICVLALLRWKSSVTFTLASHVARFLFSLMGSVISSTSGATSLRCWYSAFFVVNSRRLPISRLW